MSRNGCEESWRQAVSEKEMGVPGTGTGPAPGRSGEALRGCRKRRKEKTWRSGVDPDMQLTCV